MKLPYTRALELYETFVMRPSFTRSRGFPLRKILTMKEKRAYRLAVFGANESMRTRYPSVSADLIERHENVKLEFEKVRANSRKVRGKLQKNWDKEELLKVASDCGADLAALTRYFDPYFGKTMCMLVWAYDLGDRVYKKNKPQTLEFEVALMPTSATIQDITNKISENLVDQGIFCEPVSHGTYFDWDNLEFNQVRFTEKAFGGEIGKNYLVLLEEFGPRFRVGMNILNDNKEVKISQPKAKKLCRGYNGKCDACIMACPSGALPQDNLVVCSKYMLTHHNCSVCAKVCPVGR